MDTNLCLTQMYCSMVNGVYLFQNMGHVLPNVVIRSTAHTFDAPTSLHWKAFYLESSSSQHWKCVGMPCSAKLSIELLRKLGRQSKVVSFDMHNSGPFMSVHTNMTAGTVMELAKHTDISVSTVL